MLLDELPARRERLVEPPETEPVHVRAVVYVAPEARDEHGAAWERGLMVAEPALVRLRRVGAVRDDDLGRVALRVEVQLPEPAGERQLGHDDGRARLP